MRSRIFLIALVAAAIAAFCLYMFPLTRSLSSSLVSPNDDTRNLALMRLQSLDDAKKEQLIVDLIKQTSSSDEKSRRYALYALRQLNAAPDKVLTTMVALLDDPSEAVRREAAIGVSRLGADAAPELVKLLSVKSGRALDDIENALVAAGKDAVPHVVPALKSPNATARARAASILGKITPPPVETKPQLLPLLKDMDPLVRSKTAIALNALDPQLAATVPAHIETLKRNIWDNDTLSAINALGQLGPKAKAALPALNALLKNAHDNVKDKNAPRPLLAQALNKIDPRRNGAVGLVWDLKSPDAALRYRAAYTLSEAPDAGALPDLAKAMDDKDVYVRARATVAVARIGFDKSERLKPTLTKKAMEALTVVKEEQVAGFGSEIRAALNIKEPAKDEEAGLNEEPAAATAP